MILLIFYVPNLFYDIAKMVMLIKATSKNSYSEKSSRGHSANEGSKKGRLDDFPMCVIC